jgi:hypothetical protein
LFPHAEVVRLIKSVHLRRAAIFVATPRICAWRMFPLIQCYQ